MFEEFSVEIAGEMKMGRGIMWIDYQYMNYIRLKWGLILEIWI